MNNQKITGVILAGGKSSRMGMDKAGLVFRGKPLVMHAVSLLAPFCDQILLSSGYESHDRFGLRRISDEFMDCGPMGGIHACMKASANPHLLVLSCDMPFIDERIIRLLAENTVDDEAVIPLWKGEWQPLCASYPAQFENKFRESLEKGEFRMKDLIPRLTVRVLDADAIVGRNSNCFRNLNSPTDLETKNSREHECSC